MVFPPRRSDNQLVRLAAPIALLACTLFFCAAASAPRGALPAGAQPAVLPTMVPLRLGDRIIQRNDQDDRVEWKLPAKRMQKFRKAGVIITEQRRTTIMANAKVVHVDSHGAMLQVDEHIVDVDVPRNNTTTADQTFFTHISSHGQPDSAAQTGDVTDAAMRDLPMSGSNPGHVGESWSTHLAVKTTLGSGRATFDHLIAGFEDGLAQISVSGRGKITGTEYHLPFLLPGSVRVVGTAWYDPRSGLLTQESYFVHNQLLKPAEGEQIGFDERLTVDSTAYLIRARP